MFLIDNLGWTLFHSDHGEVLKHLPQPVDILPRLLRHVSKNWYSDGSNYLSHLLPTLTPSFCLTSGALIWLSTCSWWLKIVVSYFACLLHQWHGLMYSLTHCSAANYISMCHMYSCYWSLQVELDLLGCVCFSSLICEIGVLPTRSITCRLSNLLS